MAGSLTNVARALLVAEHKAWSKVLRERKKWYINWNVCEYYKGFVKTHVLIAVLQLDLDVLTTDSFIDFLLFQEDCVDNDLFLHFQKRRKEKEKVKKRLS